MARSKGYVLLVVTTILLMISIATLSLFVGNDQALAQISASHESAQLEAGLAASLEHNTRTLFENDQCTGYGVAGGTLGAVTYSASIDAASSSPVTLTVTAVHDNGAQRSRSRVLSMYASENQLELDPIADAMIKEDKPDDNFGDGNEMLSEATDTNKDQRALVRFDISGVPDSAVVTRAQLQLQINNNHSEDADPDRIYRLTRNWDESVVTWSRAVSGLLGYWQSAGGDQDALLQVAFADSQEIRHTLDVTRFVRLWHSGVDNYGLLIRAEHHANSNDRHYSTREATTAAERPKLTVDYRCECALGCV